MSHSNDEADRPKIILRTRKYCAANPDAEKRESVIIEYAESYDLLIQNLDEKSTVLVDKSLFVRDIVLNKRHDHIMFTLPRRWGKSINLTMLDYFLACEGGEKGSIEKRIDHLRDYLDLFDDNEFVEKHCGKYPTIFITFIELKAVDSFDMFLKKFAEIMSECFVRYEFVYKGIQARIDDCRQSRPCLANDLEIKQKEWMEIVRKEADQDTLERSLSILCKLMYSHFSEKKKYKTIILLDEFDAIVNCIYTSNQITNDDIDKVIAFFRQFVTHAFRIKSSRQCYKKVVATGVYNTLMFFDSPLTEFQVFTMKENPFAKYFGFTDEDFAYISSQFQFSKEDIKQCKIWYNGYHAYDNTKTTKSEYQMYNPASIAHFASERKFEKFLCNTKNINVMNPTFKDEKICGKISQIIQHKAIPVAGLNTKFTKEELDDLKQARHNVMFQPVDSDAFVNCFIAYMYASGYLDAFYEKGELFVRIPNWEHRLDIETKLTSYYVARFKQYDIFIPAVSSELERLYLSEEVNAQWKFDTSKLKNAMDVLMEKLPTHVSTLDRFVRLSVGQSYYGTEDIYHSLFNHIALRILNVHICGSEIYDKNGKRSDTIFANYIKNIGIIVEHKYDDSAKGQKHEVEDALIQAVGYKSIFEGHELKRIVFLGIVYKDDQSVDIDSFLWKVDDADSEQKLDKLWKKESQEQVVVPLPKKRKLDD